MGNYFSYMRISTKEERGKQRYSRQEAAMARFEKENHIEFLVVFKEDQSGKSFINRKEWNRLEKLVQSGDTIVFKDISRFTREAENGYQKYKDLMERGVELLFIDNPTVSTPYIKQLLHVAEQQNLVAKVSLESTVKLLLIVELDRVEQERLILSKRTRDGLAASENKSGRKHGQVDKLTPELRADIELYILNRKKNICVNATEIMKAHKISRNTLKKYIKIVEQIKQPAA